jgi:nucleolar GTP-binding protein
MNFQTIPPVEESTELLDLAFKRAREKGKSKQLKGTWLQKVKKKEGLKLDVVKDTLVPRLEKVLTAFPNTIEISLFYVKLMKLTLDFPHFKRSLGALHWAVKRIRSVHKQYVSKIMKSHDRAEVTLLGKEFYGRVSSFVKQINPELQNLEKSRRILKTYPDVKEMFTVCIYGFPNVGKTTLLNKLTGTKAKIAHYAFTTKSINAGYSGEVQYFDVPGTLARKEKMNVIELQAELVKDELADVLIYVFDISEYCGYTLKQQEELFKKLGKNKHTLVYLSKQDLMGKNSAKDFPYTYHSVTQLKQKVAQLKQQH